MITDDISDLKKKETVFGNISELNKASEEYAEKAEKDSKLIFVSKSVALRCHATDGTCSLTSEAVHSVLTLEDCK